MSSLAGYATQLNPTTQIVCAYASGSKTVKALTYERWLVIGTFDVPETVTARVAAFGLSTTGTEAKVAIFSDEKIVGSELTLVEGGVEQISISSVFTLVPDVSYKIAIDVQADTAGEDQFAVVRTVSLRDA